jgi:IS1 family transposase
MKVVENREASYSRSSPPEAKAISLDEMWTYQQARKRPKRRDVWIWTAVIERKDGSRGVFFEVGDRSEETFLRLMDRLPPAESYHTDGYEVYEWLPRHQHIRRKFGKGNRNEGIHSVLRDRLKRLVRRTKGYTKSLEMLRGSLALLSLRLGWI